MQRRVQKYHNVHVCSVAVTYGRGVQSSPSVEAPCGRGGDPAAGACPKALCQWGSIPLSCLEDLSSDGDGFDPPPVQSKGMSFTPVDRDGQRWTERGVVARHGLYPHSSGWLEVLTTADGVINKPNQSPAGIQVTITGLSCNPQ